MGDKNITLAKAISCYDKEWRDYNVTKCVSEAAEHINREIPAQMDSYTCTALPILGSTGQSINDGSERTTTTKAVLVLCSGVLKLKSDRPPTQ